MILGDVPHDGSVCHPLRYSDELSFLHVPLNPDEFQHVRMGQRAPEDDFLAESLEQNG